MSALDTLCENYGISDELSDEEAIKAIEEIRNTPEPVAQASVEERTAAALEFIALSSLPDAE